MPSKTQSPHENDLGVSEDPALTVRRIVFLDLDDTLIPTYWMREQLLKLRYSRQSPTYSNLLQDLEANESTIARIAKALTSAASLPSKLKGLPARPQSLPRIPGLQLGDLGPYLEIRKRLDELTEGELERVVISFLKAVQAYADKAIIITNARSQGWLRLVECLFPDMSQALRAANIEVLKTTPDLCSKGEPSLATNPAGYFEYWMTAKHREFVKVLADEEAMMAGENRSVCFELVCIGDNEFEQTAFQKVAEEASNVAVARMVRCSQGLSPRSFLEQLRAMEGAVHTWSRMGHLEVVEKRRNTGRSGSNTRLSPSSSPWEKLGVWARRGQQSDLLQVTASVTLRTWQPKKFQEWLRGRLHRENSRRRSWTTVAPRRRWMSGLWGRKKSDSDGEGSLRRYSTDGDLSVVNEKVTPV